jgi:hypothetical protein
MKKLYLLIGVIFTLLLTAGLLYGQGSQKSGRLDLQERVFDFGMVPREAKVVHDFVLKNVGNDTLKILDIKAGCACTTAPVGKKVLAVNDSTIMPVTFSTGRASGNTEKGVKITTNMEPRGLFPLAIRAYVESPTMKTPALTAEPRTMEYTPPDPEEKGTEKVELANNGDMELTLKIVDYTVKLGEPKLKDSKIKPGKKGTLEFEFAPMRNMRPVNGSVTLAVLDGDDLVMRYTIPVIRDRPIDYSSK